MNQVNDKIKFRAGIYVGVAFVFIIIIFALLGGFYDDNLQHLGIRPRTLIGVLGIFTAPVVHGDLYHLLSNAFPLLFAIPVLFYFYYRHAIPVLITVYILSGFWVWLGARDAVHLGASGVVYGLISFLFFASLLQKSKSGTAMAFVILFLYGAPLVTGFFPSPGISFEAHISGAVAGLFMAVFLKFYVAEKNIKTEEATANINTTSSEKISFTYFYKSSSDPENNRD